MRESTKDALTERTCVTKALRVAGSALSDVCERAFGTRAMAPLRQTASARRKQCLRVVCLKIPRAKRCDTRISSSSTRKLGVVGCAILYVIMMMANVFVCVCICSNLRAAGNVYDYNAGAVLSYFYMNFPGLCARLFKDSRVYACERAVRYVYNTMKGAFADDKCERMCFSYDAPHARTNTRMYIVIVLKCLFHVVFLHIYFSYNI